MLSSYRDWLRGLDLNQGPSGYEPDELPDCSTPRYFYKKYNQLSLDTISTKYSRNIKIN